MTPIVFSGAHIMVTNYHLFLVSFLVGVDLWFWMDIGAF